MIKTIGTRELFVLDRPEGLIQGTYHRAQCDVIEDLPQFARRQRLGLMFLNGLPAARAAHGNAVVYWADSLAERGYPCFRVDLPGFGDSAGDPPADWLSFINLGGYAPIVDHAIGELTKRFDLSEVVIVGHCSGAVSAIYTAVMNKTCKGLVLIDPYFYAAQTERKKSRQRLTLWADRSRTGVLLGQVFGYLKKTWLSLCENAYPENANVPLLRSWKEVTAAGLPVLILKVPEQKPSGIRAEAGGFDYFRYVIGLAGRRGQVSAESIVGANHTFSNRVGREAVRQHTEDWLATYFPRAEKVNRDTGAGRLAVECNQRAVELRECLDLRQISEC
jgi:pimeloyl-ACP methyl ester carboxylesterase